MRRSMGLLPVIGALLVAGSASAAAPTVAIDGVEVTSSTSARVLANADPNGQKTSLRAYYAPAESQWCETGGEHGSKRKSKVIKLGSGNVEISEIIIPLTGLAPNLRYCTQLLARNGSGKVRSAFAEFMTGSE